MKGDRPLFGEPATDTRRAATRGLCNGVSSRARTGGRRVQRGQALAETLVASIVLVPLVLLIILLGKYQSVQQATIAASRTLAFECTVRIDACADFDGHREMVEEIRHRHFAQHGFAVRTSTALTDANSADQRNALWVDGRNRSLLENFEDVGARVQSQSFDAGLAVSGVARGASNLAGPGHFGFDINGGLYEARVQANLSARTGADTFLSQLQSIRLSPQARTAILVDAWNASGPEGGLHSVASRVEQGARLDEAVETGFDIAYSPMRAFILMMGLGPLEPSGMNFRYHNVDVDLVPADRIGQ